MDTPKHGDPDHSEAELEQLGASDALVAAEIAAAFEHVPDDEAPPTRRVRD